MKILKRNDVFTKMADSNAKDLKQIDIMISSGWRFAAKQDYKLAVNGVKIATKEAKDEVKAEKVKKVKETKKKK